jgi:hypothetical protein
MKRRKDGYIFKITGCFVTPSRNQTKAISCSFPGVNTIVHRFNLPLAPLSRLSRSWVEHSGIRVTCYATYRVNRCCDSSPVDPPLDFSFYGEWNLRDDWLVHALELGTPALQPLPTRADRGNTCASRRMTDEGAPVRGVSGRG